MYPFLSMFTVFVLAVTSYSSFPQPIPATTDVRARESRERGSRDRADPEAEPDAGHMRQNTLEKWPGGILYTLG